MSCCDEEATNASRYANEITGSTQADSHSSMLKLGV